MLINKCSGKRSFSMLNLIKKELKSKCREPETVKFFIFEWVLNVNYSQVEITKIANEKGRKKTIKKYLKFYISTYIVFDGDNFGYCLTIFIYF